LLTLFLSTQKGTKPVSEEQTTAAFLFENVLHPKQRARNFFSGFSHKEK
jgi:hypothetical protein